MAETDRDRLNKLAELRDRGVLTEAEFQNAKARLLAGARQSPPPAEEPGRWGTILRDYWPAFAGLGVLLLMVIALIVYGNLKADEEAGSLTGIEIGNAIDENMLDAAPDGEALCASQPAAGRIRDMIFDQAVKQAGGDPARLDSLRRAVVARIQYPQFRGFRQDSGRTECVGRLILDLPPTVQSAFDGAPSLEADVEFAFQNAADGAPAVVEVRGADFVIQQLATAAGVAPAVAPAQAEPARTYNPSFDCSGTLSNVERMICQDEDLARRDRALAALYAGVRARVSGPDAQDLVDAQRAFVQRRGACADTACVRDAYVAQSRYLNQLEVAGE
jgi:uncharacterized protein YecT (DUF1311 family)